MRYVCEIERAEHVIEADTPEDAARLAAEREARTTGTRQQFRVNVAEANEADLPLIAGDDYDVTVDPEDINR